MEDPLISHEREDSEKILKQTELILKSEHIKDFSAYTPEILFILNDKRQIVYTNHLDKTIFGLRPGDFLNCCHALENIGGCGATEACQTCGAFQAIVASLNGKKQVSECRINDTDGNAIDLRVYSYPISIDGEKFAFMAFKNIDDEKRRNALERIFFHDILNTASGIKSITNLLEDPNEDDRELLIGYLSHLSSQLIEEIQSQRQLVLAENKELKLIPSSFSTIDILNEVKNYFFKSELIQNTADILIEEGAYKGYISTDKILLKRSLLNLTKNAVEASAEQSQIKIGCKQDGDEILYYVKNKEYIPRHVQLQIFSRSFSTKGYNRGLGTYSVKLLTENYLGGKVTFTSDPEDGTTFYIRIPRQIKRDDALIDNVI